MHSLSDVEEDASTKQQPTRRGILITAVMIGAVLTMSAGIYTYRLNSLSVAQVSANYAFYDNLGDLDRRAELIIVGRPTENWIDSQHVTKRFAEGTIETFHTLREIAVERVIKKPDSLNLTAGQKYQIVEPVGLIDDSSDNLDKVKMTYENYTELKKGGRYVIFLGANGLGQYGIVNMNEGKFNVDGSDPDDASVRGTKQIKERIKKDLLDKYRP